MSINTTLLRRRIAKFVDEGGFETHIGKLPGYERRGGNDVRRLRAGTTLRETTLQKMDAWLTERGF